MSAPSRRPRRHRELERALVRRPPMRPQPARGGTPGLRRAVFRTHLQPEAERRRARLSAAGGVTRRCRVVPQRPPLDWAAWRGCSGRARAARTACAAPARPARRSPSGRDNRWYRAPGARDAPRRSSAASSGAGHVGQGEVQHREVERAARRLATVASAPPRVGRGEKIEVLPVERALEQTQHGLGVVDEKDERARNVHGRGEGQRGTPVRGSRSRASG